MRISFRLALSVLLLAGLALGAATAQAADAELLGKCTICHGDRGVSDESAYPSIAGLPARLQADALRSYRDGARDCGPVARMCKIVVGMTDQQIKELAEHFAAFPFKRAQQPFKPGLVEQGRQLHEDYCAVCHGENPADAEKSILHGQWADYLRYALSQYRSGHRKQPPSMRRQTEKLSDQDIEAIVNYYASYR
ncbi:MAG TPA: c-type cytochrome [Steroidobacteraceae bacterium]|nr:c-type cytochrome [Steroidobacteraceae bacterium]